ncbi:DUF6503 family protein [Marinoscillum sp.]|uniref:DUF6503 family protein n=1 Tax=Marinoscillum sp. TaxID=2024838 RepID=UPI003BAAAD03
MKKLLWIPLLTLACQPAKKESAYSAPDHHTKTMTAILDAHGGYQRWSEMNTLSYELEGEKQVISLKDRKVLITGKDRTIGFDGTNVWVTPDTADVSRARFYHNLYFYFFAMPFVLGDPGITYEPVDSRDFQGEQLEGIKVSYKSDVGDSPDDNYILWYDPSSYQMKWLMYTVTYGKEGPNDNYSLIHYADWKDFSGLKLPTQLEWHAYKNDSIGEVRGGASFNNIELTQEAPSADLFEMPAGAQIAP